MTRNSRYVFVQAGALLVCFTNTSLGRLRAARLIRIARERSGIRVWSEDCAATALSLRAGEPARLTGAAPAARGFADTGAPTGTRPQPFLGRRKASDLLLEAAP